TAPSPRMRKPFFATLRMMPLSTSSCGPTFDPVSNFDRSLTLTVENFFLKIAFVNPRFGIRRCNGIWPPSKPRFWLLPDRDHMPLLPRAAVFPWPLPGPRPIRFVLCVEPGFGFRVLIPDIITAPGSAPGAELLQPSPESRACLQQHGSRLI